MALRPWKGPNPSGALLIFEDRQEEFVIQNSNFWNLPSPALAVSNSTITVSNSSFDQHLRWGPRVVVVDRASTLTLTGCTFSNAYCAGDGAEQIDSLEFIYRLSAPRVPPSFSSPAKHIIHSLVYNHATLQRPSTSPVLVPTALSSNYIDLSSEASLKISTARTVANPGSSSSCELYTSGCRGRHPRKQRVLHHHLQL